MHCLPSNVRIRILLISRFYMLLMSVWYWIVLVIIFGVFPDLRYSLAAWVVIIICSAFQYLTAIKAIKYEIEFAQYEPQEIGTRFYLSRRIGPLIGSRTKYKITDLAPEQLQYSHEFFGYPVYFFHEKRLQSSSKILTDLYTRKVFVMFSPDINPSCLVVKGQW